MLFVLLGLLVQIQQWPEGWIKDSLLSFGRSTPFTASVLPKDTNKSLVEAGLKEGGVKAVAAPASATAVKNEGSIMSKLEL